VRVFIALVCVIITAPIAFAVVILTGPALALGVWIKAILTFPSLLRNVYKGALEHTETITKE